MIKLSLLKLANTWLRDPDWCNSLATLGKRITFLTCQPLICGGRLRTGFFLPLFVNASMIITASLPAHLIKIASPVLPRGRVQVSEAHLLRDSDAVGCDEVHAEGSDRWSREMTPYSFCSPLESIWIVLVDHPKSPEF